MPWIEAILRGQRVVARARTDGSFLVEDGRVEIRYGAGDGRTYRAAARNLERVDGARSTPDEERSPNPPASSPRAGPHPTDSSRLRLSGPGSLRPPAPPRRAPETAGAASGTWIAYTDGACSGNPGPAGCGVVLVAPDGKMHEGLEYLGEATNNVAELTGILRAVEWAPADARALVVHTDSQYAIGVLQKGWRAKANQDLVGRAKRAVELRGARLVYVPGHQGVALNERADELAREAVQTHRSRAVQP